MQRQYYARSNTPSPDITASLDSYHSMVRPPPTQLSHALGAQRSHESFGAARPSELTSALILVLPPPPPFLRRSWTQLPLAFSRKSCTQPTLWALVGCHRAVTFPPACGGTRTMREASFPLATYRWVPPRAARAPCELPSLASSVNSTPMHATLACKPSLNPKVGDKPLCNILYCKVP